MCAHFFFPTCPPLPPFFIPSSASHLCSLSPCSALPTHLLHSSHLLCNILNIPVSSHHLFPSFVFQSCAHSLSYILIYSLVCIQVLNMLTTVFSWNCHIISYLLQLEGPSLSLCPALGLCHNYLSKHFLSSAVRVYMSVFPPHCGLLILLFQCCRYLAHSVAHNKCSVSFE